MTLRELCDGIRAARLTMRLDPENVLRIAPKSAITPALADGIRAHKAAFVRALKGNNWSPRLFELEPFACRGCGVEVVLDGDQRCAWCEVAPITTGARSVSLTAERAYFASLAVKNNDNSERLTTVPNRPHTLRGQLGTEGTVHRGNTHTRPRVEENAEIALWTVPAPKLSPGSAA